MKNLIVYASKHGCAESCAQQLQERLPGNTQLFSLKEKRPVSLDGYDTVIVGGSIHAGRIQKRVGGFCREFADLLKSVRLGLFLCCMEQGENAENQFREAFPEELRDHAAVSGLFGGVFDFKKMNFLERKIVKKVAGVDSSVSRIDREAIDRFVKSMS
jgi:menaquinone-dependent protoporphyrinogen oxidase